MLKLKLNEKGQVLIAAMALSMFFIAAYAGYQAYWSSLVSVQTQYRDALNLMDAVDRASSDIRASWDKATTDESIAVGSPPAPPPTAKQINTLLTSNLAKYLPSLDPSCSVGAGCTGAGCCPTSAALCYSNPTNSSYPFCFFSSAFAAGKTTTSGLDFRLVLPEKKKSGVGEIIAHIVHKFRGQGLFESKSLAAATVIVPRTDNVLAAPTCTTANCMVCGLTLANLAANANVPVCATIYACPTGFSQCSGYNAAPSAAKAIFVQQFSLTPSGGI